MKKLVFLILICSPVLVFSQKSSIGLTGGYITNGYGGSLEFNKHFGNNSIFKISGNYSLSVSEQDRPVEDIDYETIGLNLGYHHKILKQEEGRVLLTLGLGAIVGYENINDGTTDLDTGALLDAESQVLYGGYVGGTFDYFLSNFVSLSVVANEYYHANSDLGSFSFYAGIGVKYFIF